MDTDEQFDLADDMLSRYEKKEKRMTSDQREVSRLLLRFCLSLPLCAAAYVVGLLSISNVPCPTIHDLSPPSLEPLQEKARQKQINETLKVSALHEQCEYCPDSKRHLRHLVVSRGMIFRERCVLAVVCLVAFRFWPLHVRLPYFAFVVQPCSYV